MADFFTEYNQHVDERSKEGIPPLALTREQATDVVELLQNIPAGQGETLALLRDRVNPGVDPAAHVKADFLIGMSRVHTLATLSQRIRY